MGAKTDGRILLMTAMCIGARVALTLYARSTSRHRLRILGYAAVAVSIGFAIIYAGNLRKVGLETLGRPIWWDALRPVHSALWLAFALYAIRGRSGTAWKLLAADTALGTAAFVAVRLG